MADDVIFVRRGEGLVSLAVAPYEAEAVLQELLEHHPQLLAGYEMSRSDPRRFLLEIIRTLVRIRAENTPPPDA